MPGIRPGQMIVLRLNPVPWQKKGTAYSRYPVSALNPSKAQLAARIQLAEAATRHAGTTGKINGLPAVAALIQGELGGKTTGGKSRSERAAASHSMAAGHINAMKAKLAKM